MIRRREPKPDFRRGDAAFKKGFVAEPFETVQIYNLMCKF